MGCSSCGQKYRGLASSPQMQAPMLTNVPIKLTHQSDRGIVRNTPVVIEAPKPSSNIDAVKNNG